MREFFTLSLGQDGLPITRSEDFMIDLIVIAAFALLLDSHEQTCKRTDEVQIKVESHLDVDAEGYCVKRGK